VTIGGYFKLNYHMLLMAIGGTILLMVIGGYFIGGYFRLNYRRLFGGYFINGY
jgi:hypothetical protein